MYRTWANESGVPTTRLPTCGMVCPWIPVLCAIPKTRLAAGPAPVRWGPTGSAAALLVPCLPVRIQFQWDWTNWRHGTVDAARLRMVRRHLAENEPVEQTPRFGAGI